MRMHLRLCAPLMAAAAMIAAAPVASAQPQTERILAAAKQLRVNAEQLKATLPPEARAEMLRQADAMEKEALGGGYRAYDNQPKPPTLAEELMAEHGRLEWLTPNGACAGYTLENFDTFRFQPQINDQDSHCGNAYRHYASYLHHAKTPAGAEFAAQSLFYYDAAARRAAGRPRRAVR